jgi:hypothetical protein
MNKEKLQRWLDNEFEKDKKELENDKKKFIENLKKIKKEEIFKTKKLSLWQRIKKVLMGW